MNQLSRFCLAIGLLFAAPSWAQQPALQRPGADEAFAAIRAVSGLPGKLEDDIDRVKELDAARWRQLQTAHAQFVVAVGEWLLTDYPDDPRRWQVIDTMLDVAPPFDGSGSDARKAAWEIRRPELRAQLLNAKGVPEKIVTKALANAVFETIGGRNNPGHFKQARQLLDELAVRSPTAPARVLAEEYYLDALRAKNETAEFERRLNALQSDSNRAVVAMARVKMSALLLKRKPVELEFPDLDGRKVDLRQLRGKVVLLDFWATWCHSCMEDMPSVRAVYETYHGRGFEIIGISDDIPASDPNNAKGIEKTVKTLKSFLAKHGMRWPQLWDPRPHAARDANSLFVKFDVHELPATMLLDREGNVYSTDNSGAKLESNVRNLLGLATRP